jgi:uncharacterized damage-inducible protein DinB
VSAGAPPLEPELLRWAAGYLGEYLVKIRDCVRRLDEEQLWWRPNSESNSVGNLLLHLCGNLAQWILSSFGGEEDRRRRPEEFAADRTHSAAELLARLEEVVRRCQATFAGLGAAELASTRVVQGGPHTGLEIVIHPVEHMSYHTGQIVYVAKMLLEGGGGIDFYPHLKRR